VSFNKVSNCFDLRGAFHLLHSWLASTVSSFLHIVLSYLLHPQGDRSTLPTVCVMKLPAMLPGRQHCSSMAASFERPHSWCSSPCCKHGGDAFPSLQHISHGRDPPFAPWAVLLLSCVLWGYHVFSHGREGEEYLWIHAN